MRLAHILRAQTFHASNKFDPEKLSCEKPQAFLTLSTLRVSWIQVSELSKFKTPLSRGSKFGGPSET